MTNKNKTLILATAFLSMFFNQAHAIEALDLQVSRLGDVNLSCGQLSQEAILMRDIILTTQNIKDEGDFQNKGITAAGAVGSFLVGSATGGIGIGIAGYLLKEATNGKTNDADTIQDIAAQRRSLMMGIYNAKGCAGPLDHAMLENVVNESEEAERLASINTAGGKDANKPRYNQ